jgi:hypothetical protein
MKPLPNPISENEVKLRLRWSADERTTEALRRQSRLRGFDSPTDYTLQLVAVTLANNEENTVVESVKQHRETHVVAR